MIQFLEHLDRAVQAESGGIREWVATHPPTAERIEELRRAIAAAGLEPGAGVTGEERFRSRTGR
jgi:predicted Zn-dependent protease